MGVRTPGWGALGGDQAAASGQRSKDIGASPSWGIMWPPRMPKASKTRVFARTLKVFLGGSWIHFRTRQSCVIAGVDGGRAFLVLELPPFATLTNSSPQVCFLLKWEPHVGRWMPPRIPSPPPTDFLSILTDSPDPSQPQQWGLGFFAHIG